ncbi:MAG: hypothetical protein V7629_21165 [Motiliproteus sp.]
MSTSQTASLTRPLIVTLAVLMLGLMSGCAATPEELAAYKAAMPGGQGQEQVMRKRWMDKPYRELVAHMGREGLVMDIPRYGWPPSSAVVYGYNEATGCVDSFLVMHGEEPMIKDYFCR